VQYALVANVAAIPGTPGNSDAIEIADSTGIESFTPLTNLPAGFVGDSGLSVRLQYLSAGSSWNWLNYFANNAETRYLKLAGGTLTGQLKADDSTSVAAPVIAFDGDTNTGVAHTGADELALVTGGTSRLTINSSGAVAIAGALTKGGNNVVTVGDTGTVTSTMLLDGTIVNADINASAAIAGTKISPNFGSQTVQTTGIFSHALGTASAPTITFTGDTNTGIYSPGADQVAISTGGTGRITIDASGNVNIDSNTLYVDATNNRVGINTIPGVAFDVAGASRFDHTAVDALSLLRGGVKVGDIGGSAGGGTFSFRSAPSTPISFSIFSSEVARIDSSGRLGLGTSSPSDKLSVYTSSASDTVIGIGNTAGNGWAGYLTGGGDLLYGLQTAGNVAIRTNNTNRIYVTSAGNVGIGTTSPSYVLDLSTTSANSFRITTPSEAGSPVILTANSNAAPAANQFFVAHSGEIVNIGNARNALALFAANSERARIDSSGRLLVGTSSALNEAQGIASFQVAGTGNGSSGISAFRYSADNQPARINLVKSRGASVGTNTVVQSGDIIGRITFNADNGSSFLEAAQIAAEVDGAVTGGGANDMPGRLVFSTTADGASSPTERMRITSGGIHGMFSATDAISLHTAATAGTTATLISGRHSATAVFNGTYSFLVYSNGNVQNTNNSYGAISDAKLKKNIVDANSQWDDLKALQVRNYNFKEGQTHTQIGLVAQEAELVSPGLVTESPDRDDEGNDLGTVTKSVNYSVLYMKAVKALQEAMERIETLEAKVAALEAV
jgi:hypothetical protein